MNYLNILSIKTCSWCIKETSGLWLIEKKLIIIILRGYIFLCLPPYYWNN